MRPSRPSQRGGAVVELAIMSVAFVSTLLLGLYFAEVGYISLKVQEATNFALLDASGRRVHKFTYNHVAANMAGAYKYFTQPNGAAGSSVKYQARYQDFDGVGTGATNYSQTMAEGRNLKVKCEASGAGAGADPIRYGLPNIGGSSRSELNQVESFLRNRLFRDIGGISCSASAELRAFNFPSAFMEKSNGSLAATKLFEGKPLTICGVGRAKNGQCKGEYALLTGDWSFESNLGEDSNTDALQMPNGTMKPGGNRAYRSVVKRLYELNGDGAQGSGGGFTRAQRLMQHAGGFSASAISTTYNERQFLFSDSGIEHGFKQPMPQANANLDYNTSGVYLKSAGPNSKKMKYAKCFLGIARNGCQ